jgi:hypothetical protein
MCFYSLDSVFQSVERHKLFVVFCSHNELALYIDWLKAQEIHSINMGIELSMFINGLFDAQHLDILVSDYVKKLLDQYKTKIKIAGNEVVAVYNLGILFEPSLELNATKLLKDFSKTASLIIIWENQFETPIRLHWPSQSDHIFFDFTETTLKKLHNAI